jgi:hypothetical protein
MIANEKSTGPVGRKKKTGRDGLKTDGSSDFNPAANVRITSVGEQKAAETQK